MNKKFLKHYMETEPEGTAKKYIFLIDNQDIAMNIVMSGYQALYLGQEDDEYYFSVDSFIEEMRSIQFHGTCQSAYHYVAACTTKWMNDQILEFCKDAGLDGKVGWQLFKEKEYLGKLDNQPEVGKVLEQFILRYEREPKNEPELSLLTEENQKLQTELSRTQNINLSLQRSNDDLRNRNGLLSRKEQEQFEEKIRDVQARNSELQVQIDISLVEAVNQAQKKQKEAEEQARFAECQAERERKQADVKIQKTRKNAKREINLDYSRR